MESEHTQDRINKTIVMPAESVQLPSVWHRIEIFRLKNESDFPRITIPPSNQTWALVCCRGYKIVNLRALTLGFALWSYKCPNNFLGRLMFPDWYPMQARYVTFTISVVFVLVILAVTVLVIMLARQRRLRSSSPPATPPTSNPIDGNPNDQEPLTTDDVPRPPDSSGVSRNSLSRTGPSIESHYLEMTSHPMAGEDEAGYTILMSKRQKKTTTATSASLYANVQDKAKVENVYEELKL
ncbi:uncharacterized protein LOC122250768 isoform X2 [Penaeus japonicus]|nr:uncharacterized protein LOC122250768 isoform X2 [Penaeus japonicus]